MVSLLGSSYLTDQGLYVPNYDNITASLAALKTFRLEDNEYLLCSYPKSGTHWVNEIMSMLFTNSTQYTTAPMRNLESGSCLPGVRRAANTFGSCARVFQTHLPWDLLPEHLLQQKIVYVMRNPLDQMVSLYFHYQGFRWAKDMTFQQFFWNITSNPDHVEYGTWFRNCYQWYMKFKNCPNVLILFYENLKTDLEAEVAKIAEFYKLNVSKEFIRAVAEKTQFKEMKDNKPMQEWFFDWHKESFSIYRCGKIGSWRSYFTPQMYAEFDLFVQSQLEASRSTTALLPYDLTSLVSLHAGTHPTQPHDQLNLSGPDRIKKNLKASATYCTTPHECVR